ncbi:MAG: ATPase, T2SS/T4P/T4SS family [Verrucomicrobiota bacterium]|nr:ATPase, T2SS/T4P/T4SS family [Verrucomicrobiota bacterium]
MFEAHNDTIISILQTNHLLNADQLSEMNDEIPRSGKSATQIALDYGIVDEPTLLELIAVYLGYEYLPMETMEVPPSVIEMLDAHTVRMNSSIPVSWDGMTLTVALADPFALQVLDDLRFTTGKDISMVVASPSKVEDAIRKYYGEDSSMLDVLGAQILEEEAERIGAYGLRDAKDIEAEANTTPVVKYVNLVLYRAIQAHASDIHFEPFQDIFRIRYRVDGGLLEMAPPPRQMALPVISRIKVMAAMNIAERRLPQDGRIQLNVANRPVDLRVSTLPTQYGESVVLRVLDKSTVKMELDGLGMPEGIFGYINEVIRKPNGIFVVTGPTGSGKTTTLYACLNKINDIEIKILTAEDPVEYEVEGIQQVPVNDNIGLTFAKILRAFLRQDPDVILIGETRDLETAQIAIQASLTGHLVLSTLHTNDAPGAVTRLIDMGVEPFLISSSLEGVLAQRLVRTICKSCKTSYEPNDTALDSIGLSAHEMGDKMFFTGAGCPDCNMTGYRGRKGIYELLDVTEPIRDMINQRAPSVVIRQKAIELGMSTLRDDGLRSIFDGATTIEEVIKYT